MQDRYEYQQFKKEVGTSQFGPVSLVIDTVHGVRQFAYNGRPAAISMQSIDMAAQQSFCTDTMADQL